jgi:hypothetical protein
MNSFIIVLPLIAMRKTFNSAAHCMPGIRLLCIIFKTATMVWTCKENARENFRTGTAGT